MTIASALNRNRIPSRPVPHPAQGTASWWLFRLEWVIILRLVRLVDRRDSNEAGAGLDTVMGGFDVVPGESVGEAVPFVSRHFGAVLMAFTLCFVTDPAAIFRETRRLLADGGGLVIGFLPRGTPWADLYALRAARGQPGYRDARFYTAAELEQLLADSGFRVIARRRASADHPRYRRGSLSAHYPRAGGLCAAPPGRPPQRWHDCRARSPKRRAPR